MDEVEIDTLEDLIAMHDELVELGHHTRACDDPYRRRMGFVTEGRFVSLPSVGWLFEHETVYYHINLRSLKKSVPGHVRNMGMFAFRHPQFRERLFTYPRREHV